LPSLRIYGPAWHPFFSFTLRPGGSSAVPSLSGEHAVGIVPTIAEYGNTR
jgi:hypothetical protein